MAYKVNLDEQQDYELSDYDVYSKTPPRTKILRKNRERKQRANTTSGINMSSPKVIKPKTPLNRRNTVSSMFEDLVANAENDSDQGNKRVSKRQMKLLRGSERDLKLDIATAQASSIGECPKLPKTPQPSWHIQSCKRFRSLLCRTVPCQVTNSVVPIESNNQGGECAIDITDDCPSSRVEFYETFSKLIRMGRGEKSNADKTQRTLSREEVLWKNELSDLIWLELQAYHADRTPTEQDNYLCTEREKVEPLLNDIMNYKFKRHLKSYTSQNSDSGVEDDCVGCLQIDCLSCLEAQNEAMRDIEELNKRLDAAEALFPSAHAFAELYPLYNKPEFVGRIKAIALWYNMVRNQRLKILILTKVLENKILQFSCRDESDSASPSDSNNSSSSSNVDVLDVKQCLDPAAYLLNVFSMLANKYKENKESPYRKYIENILKTRTLHKTIDFLDKLQVGLLSKTQWTLTEPENEDFFKKNTFDNDEDEMKRYGIWSPEARALNLPSYRANFLYLSVMPLKMIHEFLKMRLEQKPQNPSPLSVRQLMRELKQGLKIACMQKEKTLQYVRVGISGTNKHWDFIQKKISDYDQCMMHVFADYLDYLKQWALLQHDSFPKNLLEEEYCTSNSVIIKQIPEAIDLLNDKYCEILAAILEGVVSKLNSRIEEILATLQTDDKSAIKRSIFSICRELQTVFNDQRDMSVKTLSFTKSLRRNRKTKFTPSGRKLGMAIGSIKCAIPVAIDRIQNLFDHINLDCFEELERSSLNSRVREVLMQAYRFGFEFHKEMSENGPDEFRQRIAISIVQFANLWMTFVTERCDRGRGMRPRWAYQGLEFLLSVCDPRNTKHLSDEEFEELKCKMDVCISHVIGTTAPSTPDSGFFSGSPRASIDHIRARSRGSSPSPRPSYKSQRSNGRKTSMEQGSPVTDNLDSISFNKRDEKRISRQYAIESLESSLNERLRQQQLIGKVVNCSNGGCRPHIRHRYVTFTWQRGIKIGQGRFGKVYTAVNNETGEMMAVKEIALQHNDTVTIKRVAEEMKILEGIHQQNLVKYYGVEVHKNEMLIFMEFCAEGTLESLVVASENGLPESLVRRYTFQLVNGVAILHEHGIVHRDIKTANIFLTDNGNCLKIGDFGCATKIKSNSTMPGELQGFVGTQAYMAPEVFTKNMNEGHGRAADIWSVGCVVVEMASGKRPWHQFEANYQIMFQVGMGESPEPPDTMTDEGLDFLECCFKHNPKDRALAHDLLVHNFVKGGDEF